MSDRLSLQRAEVFKRAIEAAGCGSKVVDCEDDDHASVYAFGPGKGHGREVYAYLVLDEDASTEAVLFLNDRGIPGRSRVEMLDASDVDGIVAKMKVWVQP